MSLNFELVATKNAQIGIATLNVEKSLNSLNLQMIESLYFKLRDWEKDPTVMGILIKGQGRAFCAGGDVRALYDSMVDETNYAEKFFEKEYRLDCALYTFNKPVIVWAHGITMGGGMGIMQGAQFRVVTESTRMAMPEITIGLFPDVGASHFLKKVPNNWGLFLEVTGARIKGSEAIQLKLADYFVKDESQASFIEHLKTLSVSTPEEFKGEVTKYFTANSQKAEGGDIFEHSAFINEVLKHSSAKSLMGWANTYSAKNEWETQLLKNIQSACPTSLELIYTLWEKSKGWKLGESFYYEWFVASQCGHKSDFREGVRALLIDKDNQPKWNPTLDKLSPQHINSHFTSPKDDGSNPLEFLRK